MERKAFLTSNGITESLRQPFAEFAESCSNIDTAVIMNGAEETTDYIIRVCRNLGTYGLIPKVIDLREYQNRFPILERDLSKFGFVHLAGGSTTRLMHRANPVHLASILKTLGENGMLLISESGGTIAAGPSIKPACWHPRGERKPITLTHPGGLNYVREAYFVHFEDNREWRNLLKEQSRKVHYPIIPFCDEQAAVYKGSKYQVIGKNTQSPMEQSTPVTTTPNIRKLFDPKVSLAKKIGTGIAVMQTLSPEKRISLITGITGNPKDFHPHLRWIIIQLKGTPDNEAITNANQFIDNLLAVLGNQNINYSSA